MIISPTEPQTSNTQPRLQVALLADDAVDDDNQGRDPVPDAPPDVVVESGVTFPRMNQCATTCARALLCVVFPCAA